MFAGELVGVDVGEAVVVFVGMRVLVGGLSVLVAVGVAVGVSVGGCVNVDVGIGVSVGGWVGVDVSVRVFVGSMVSIGKELSIEAIDVPKSEKF